MRQAVYNKHDEHGDDDVLPPHVAAFPFGNQSPAAILCSILWNKHDPTW